MTVSELMQELSQMPMNADVHFAYNYGDHWRTLVAPAVQEVEHGRVSYSAYHQMDAVKDNEDGSDPGTDEREVVILR